MTELTFAALALILAAVNFAFACGCFQAPKLGYNMDSLRINFRLYNGHVPSNRTLRMLVNKGYLTPAGRWTY